HSAHRRTVVVDAVVADHGVLANDDLYHQLVPGSVNLGEVDHTALRTGEPQTLVSNPEGSYRLLRIGDAVAGRNIHAAIYDALRFARDL
ncbi:MAG: N-methylproline demethylase, partial [Actinomycetota bacterium]